MAKSVGLDIHARGVRAVEVTGRGKSFRIARYMERSVTPRGGEPDPEELREALLEIFKTGKFTRNHVISAVEAQSTVVREIPVPFTSDDQIKKVIKYEAEHHLHDCDADDVVVQYTKVGESAEGTNLLVFAARKEAIGRRIDYARSAGVEPLAMDLDSLAVFEAVRASDLLDQWPNCVLLDIGHRSTGMVFIVDGRVRGLRAVRIGVDSITQGLARDMDIDFVEADSKLAEMTLDEGGDLFVPAEEGALTTKPETEKSHAELERDLLHQKRDEFVGRLKREFIRSSAALHGGARPEHVIATGPGVQVPGLLELLGSKLGMAIEVFRPSQQFTCKLNGLAPEEFDAGAAVALGLALKGIGRDSLGIDFRQEELQVANKFELLKNTLAFTVSALFAGLLVFSLYSVLKKSQIQDERFEPLLTEAYQSFAEVARKYNDLGEKHVPPRYRVDPNEVEKDGDRYDAVKRFNSKLRRMRTRLYSIVGDSKGLPQIESALHTWNGMFGAFKEFHEKIDYVDIESIVIRQKDVRLNLLLPSTAAGEIIAEPLKGVMKGMVLNDDWGGEPVGNFQRIRFHFKRPTR